VPLFCQGVKLLTDSELVELSRTGADFTSPVLTAMAVGGEDVTPDDAFLLLDVTWRLNSLPDERGHELLNRGLDRLQAAFPSVLG